MEDQLRAILGQVGGLSVPISDVTASQDLYVAGLTSFATVTVMLAIEEYFDVEFPDSLLNRATFRSIETLLDVIARLKAGRVAA